MATGNTVAVGFMHDEGLLNVQLAWAKQQQGYRTLPSLYATTRVWQMIPQRLYRESDIATYLADAPGFSAASRFTSVSLPSISAIGVFPVGDVQDLSESSIGHVAELFVAASDRLSRGERSFGTGFLVGRVLWTVLFRDGGLIHLSTAYVDADADAVFFLAAHYQHFGLDRSACPFFLGGALAESGQLHRQIGIYFDLRTLSHALRYSTGEYSPSLELLLAYDEALQQEFSYA